MSIKRSVSFARILSAIGFSRAQLSASLSRLQASVTFSKINQAIIFARLQSQVVLGEFIKIIRLSDSVDLSDQESKAVGTSKSDSTSTDDQPRKGFGKALDDLIELKENVITGLTKLLSDTASADDDTQVGLGKSLTDTFGTGDAIQSFQFGKKLDDTARATDDVGGEASVDDDQTIAFFKVTGDIAGADDNLSRVVSFTRAFSDGSGVTDLPSIAFNTSPSDNATFSDDAVISYGMNPDENIGATDNFSKTVAYTRGLTDSTGAADVFRIRNFSKSLSDTSSVADVFVSQMSFSRLLSDNVNATDDVNGAAVDDDQTIHFFKVLGDSSSVGDSEVKSTGKDLGDSASASDAGSFIVQGYTVDNTYFASDYVGSSGSF
tara:strand:+ start:14985 stop:16118 length:1134 start_codon:yes stop_codon:yes gene_type:complete